ncbi:MAG: membrane protein insertion efficiency factor YidD [Dehalococcoidia bacterium]
MSWILLSAIKLYRATLSPMLGGHCRFEPSCSRYSEQAIKTYGALRGSWMTVKRLARCTPFSRGGLDPVPPVDGARA